MIVACSLTAYSSLVTLNLKMLFQMNVKTNMGMPMRGDTAVGCLIC